MLAMFGHQAGRRSYERPPRASGRPRSAGSEHAQTSFDNDEYELLEEEYDSDDYEVGSLQWLARLRFGSDHAAPVREGLY